ncbi:hypothetical protein FB645_000214 [Coemansia sp. IMI 203386]|nr:hypothetical protein FB645_000214 [Coemansia sp. IMI 203386]
MATEKRYSLRVDGRADAAEAIKQQTYAQLVGGSIKTTRYSHAGDGSDSYSRLHTSSMPHIGPLSPTLPSPSSLSSSIASTTAAPAAYPLQPSSTRDNWRRSFQGNNAVFNLGQRRSRRASMAMGPANAQQRHRPRPHNHDISAAATLVAHKRMSLDSIQHAAISRRIVNEHIEAGGHISSQYLDSISEFGRPMWSNEQLRRARRFSSSHTRGSSCPTLNITRIMRSISVSSGSSSGASSNTSTISVGARESHALAKKARRYYSLAPAPATSEPIVYRGECSSTRKRGSNIFKSNSNSPSDSSNSIPASGDQGFGESQQTLSLSLPEDQAHSSSSSAMSSGNNCLSQTPARSEGSRIPPRIIVDGLRRRTTAGRHEAATPDLVVQNDDLPSPLSPPLTEEACLDALYQLDATGASATPSISSATSSARWSTISAESPHKRYSYSSAAIAEALRDLQSAARHSTASLGEPLYQYQSSTLPLSLLSDPALLRADDSSSNSRSISIGSGDEKMTITLKGPPRKQDDAQPGNDTTCASCGSNGTTSSSSNVDKVDIYEQHSSDNTQATSSGNNSEGISGKSNGFKSFPRLDNGNSHLDSSSGRPSTDGMRSSGEVPIPAIYLDSTASLWDQYMAELDSSEFDSKIHLKRQRVSQFLRVPWNVEKLLWFGVAICFDALIYVFSILPAKFVRAAFTLMVSIFYELPELIDDVCTSTIAQIALQALPDVWRTRLSLAVRRVRHWSCRLVGRESSYPSSDAASVSGGGSRSMSRWLSPAQLFDFYRGLLLIFTCVALCRIDAAQMYHSIRAQSSLKLYFIYSALDIFDRLLSSFGHDVLDALQSTVTDPRSQRWKTGAGYFVLAQTYMLVHTLVLFYQVITLNVAVNAYSDQLLSLLISNQFVEIKSNVFKKWEKEMLFQVACADISERFQEIVFLFIIILRNIAELSGTGMSPIFGTPSATSSTSGGTATVMPTVQPPVSFDSATPSAFGPLIPTWVSGPLINRILTPIFMVLGTEILIDWIKHAFITKLNWIRPEIYSHYMDILSRDLACSKSGVRARGVLPLGHGSSHLAPSDTVEAVSDADEKIENSCGVRNSTESNDNGSSLARTRSSSILVHAALKAIAWVQTNLLSDSATVRSNDQQEESQDSPDQRRSSNAASRPSSSGVSTAGYGRRRGHRRVQSVTQPQIFVEQSSRVARRIGLSPMPLACLITLMLMQVSYILTQPSGLQYGDSPVPTASSPFGTSWLLGWLLAVPILGFLVRTLAATCRMVYSMLSIDAISHFGNLVTHPRKAAASLAAVFASPWAIPALFAPSGRAGGSARLTAPTGWAMLDVLGWVAIVLIAYALVVWAKLTFGSRLMQFAWNRYRDFERRTAENKGKENDTGNLKQFDDETKKLDNSKFFEVGKLIANEGSEAEWDKQKPKLTLDNIERYTLFKSRIP